LNSTSKIHILRVPALQFAGSRMSSFVLKKAGLPAKSYAKVARI